MSDAIIQIRNLSVDFPSEAGRVQAVRGLNLDVRAGEVLGLVGESGSGKSVTSLSMIGLLPPTARVSGEILYGGKNLLELSDDEMSKYRGSDIAMVFQDPLSALNPVRTIGHQIAEAILIHKDVTEEVALKRAIELLDIVGIPRPNERVNSYPHEFSGGMRQRVQLAKALANEPPVILLDEPTTGLDASIAAGVLDLIRNLLEETGVAAVVVSHDFAVIEMLTTRCVVMNHGRIVESGLTDRLLEDPHHPYSQKLVGAARA